MQKRYLIVHRASLAYWPGDLDDHIHAILDAGADGVELSYGINFIYWQPVRETIQRLCKVLVTLHAEIYNQLDITLDTWTEAMCHLPWHIANATFHPNELMPKDFVQLSNSPFFTSLENMDTNVKGWHTAQEIQQDTAPGVGFTLDVNHAAENNLSVSSFNILPTIETHISIADNNYYTEWGYQTHHAMTQFQPNNFPIVPSSCPIITVEGLIPPDKNILRDEIEFIRRSIQS